MPAMNQPDDVPVGDASHDAPGSSPRRRAVPERSSTGPELGAGRGSSSPLRAERCSSATCCPANRWVRPHRELTVATYPRANAFKEVTGARLTQGAHQAGASTRRARRRRRDERHKRPPRLSGPLPDRGLLAPCRRGPAPRRERHRQAVLLARLTMHARTD